MVYHLARQGAVPDEPAGVVAAELQRMGVSDPAARDATERLSLLRYAVALGASPEELTIRSDPGELILDLRMRPRLELALGQAVADAGLDWGDAERLLDTLGLATDPDAPITADELEAVRLMAGVATELLGFETAVQLARAVSGGMARLAEAVVTALRLRVELPRRDAGTSYEQIVREVAGLADTMLPSLVRTLNAVLRYQIVRVAEPTWSTDTERAAVVLPRTVGFADLVGYTVEGPS